jgi:hypothetical protein
LPQIFFRLIPLRNTVRPKNITGRHRVGFTPESQKQYYHTYTGNGLCNTETGKSGQNAEIRAAAGSIRKGSNTALRTKYLPLRKKKVRPKNRTAARRLHH